VGKPLRNGGSNFLGKRRDRKLEPKRHLINGTLVVSRQSCNNPTKCCLVACCLPIVVVIRRLHSLGTADPGVNECNSDVSTVRHGRVCHSCKLDVQSQSSI